ncbi:hypothetical protein B0H67DRAFT_550682 [Lasiosphaeris hirsuta]|uniref:Zn(2)-C6 fungal-type domain-containing protein n=1 Tax=Lasiosphaeris hirsuta TaxID=260670 RepID=A0AA40AZV0_9PEZI|nr:hypothetical protein B0H67DRAFT_550682 [Lasiosphaeris hirsuta]
MSDLPPLQPGRKRRAHKRSRNGCLTCKQRHIRCDEVKPICTNCLTRGGDCGYPEPASTLAPPGAGGSASASGSVPRPGIPGAIGLGATDPTHQRLVPIPSSPADPFDSLPIKMPHRSLELFHHFAHYRIFSRTAVPKNPNSDCVGLALSDPGTFRACLLMTALNYSWLSGGSLRNTDMEETYLYHKLEAMRIVNEQIADPAKCTSDGCLALIAALALVESGMGDHTAAEAHLNGLFTLLDMRRPEEWEHRFYGLLQRIILIAGSYIAAAKKPTSTEALQLASEEPEASPHYTKAPSSLFSVAPTIATRLSPFYLGSSPGIEACKADVEGQVLVNALRRLSDVPVIETATAESSRSSSSARRDGVSSPASPSRTSSPPTAGSQDVLPPHPDATAILLADTDAYIASLLFKPQPIYRDIQPSHLATAGFSNTDDESDDEPTPVAAARIPSSLATPARPGFPPHQPPARRVDPFATLPAINFPSASRAWATAAYLYLHVVLARLCASVDTHGCGETSTAGWNASGPTPRSRSTSPAAGAASGNRPAVYVEPHLLRLLLDTLREDVAHTEDAMRAGAYSSELWAWKVVVGAYAVALTGGAGAGAAGGARKSNKGKGRAGPSFWGWVVQEEQAESSSSDDDDSEEDDEDDQMEIEGGNGPDEYMAGMRAWFDARLRVWSAAAHVGDWAEARAMLARIVWPESGSVVFDGEAVAEGIWRRALGQAGRRELPLMVVVDPRLG